MLETKKPDNYVERELNIKTFVHTDFVTDPMNVRSGVMDFENDLAVLNLFSLLGDKNKEYQQTITQLIIDRESLLAKYREIENEDINNIQDEITSFMIHQEKY